MTAEDCATTTKALAAKRHADRIRARNLLVVLHCLPAGIQQRADLRDELAMMHLPLAEHLARRFDGFRELPPRQL